MPMYEFACSKCDHVFEELVFGDEEVACPKCAAKKVERQVSLPGLPVMAGGSSASWGPCGDPSLPPCGAAGCRRTGGR